VFSWSRSSYSTCFAQFVRIGFSSFKICSVSYIFLLMLLKNEMLFLWFAQFVLCIFYIQVYFLCKFRFLDVFSDSYWLIYVVKTWFGLLNMP